MKYNSIMNTHNLSKKLSRMLPDDINFLMTTSCEVTEKIHGENFKIGKTAKNELFIGQKNQIFYEGHFDEHPNWEKINEKTKNQITKILDYVSGYHNREICLYGELCGNGLQSGFTFPFDGYEILFMDVTIDGKYINKVLTRKIIKALRLQYVPYITTCTLKEALDMDVNSMASSICENDYIEGVVIASTMDNISDRWKFLDRLIIKHKTDKYAEVSKSKKQKKIKTDMIVSEFANFVTDARIENVLTELKETESVSYEMSDLKFLSKALIENIEKEENDGNKLGKDDNRYLKKIIPSTYRKFLENKTKQLIEDAEKQKPKKRGRKPKAKAKTTKE